MVQALGQLYAALSVFGLEDQQRSMRMPQRVTMGREHGALFPAGSDKAAQTGARLKGLSNGVALGFGGVQRLGRF